MSEENGIMTLDADPLPEFVTLTPRNTPASMELVESCGAVTAIPWSEGDDKMVIIIHAPDDDDTIVVKAGEGIVGAENLVFEIRARHTALLKLDSGRFKCISGPNKGKVVIQNMDKTVYIGVAALV